MLNAITGCFSGEHTQHQYIINIINNSGTVAVGDNNVVGKVQTEANGAGDVNSNTGPRNDHCDSCERLLPNNAGSEGTWKSTKRGTSKQKHRRNSKEEDCVREVSKFKRKKINDRKRIKRQERTSRCSQQSSDGDTPDPTRNELAIKGDNRESLKRELKKFHRLTMDLHPLRDNGRWTEFDCRTQQYLDQHTCNPAVKSFILLEVSVSMNYQKELEQSEDTINKAVTEIEKTSGSVRRLLELLFYCYLAGLYRRKKMLGKTEECLKRAREYIAGFPPSLPVAILLYEEGSFKRDFAAICSNKKPAITEAKELMQCCIDLCHGLNPMKVYKGKLPFAISKKAIIALHCETSTTRNETIDANSISEAGASLETLQTEDKRMEVSEGAKIQGRKGLVDFYYRTCMFTKAEQIALEALEVAGNLGFKLENKPFEERLRDIRQKLMESPSSGPYRESQDMIDSSSQTTTPVSSENEVEVNL